MANIAIETWLSASMLKTSLKTIVAVIPKEGWTGGAPPILLFCMTLNLESDSAGFKGKTLKSVSAYQITAGPIPEDIGVGSSSRLGGGGRKGPHASGGVCPQNNKCLINTNLGGPGGEVPGNFRVFREIPAIVVLLRLFEQNRSQILGGGAKT